MTAATISGLVEGQTYYFAATTYDVLNRESVFSDEIAYTVPLPVTNPPPVITQMPTTIRGSVGQTMTCSISATGDGPLVYTLDWAACGSIYHSRRRVVHLEPANHASQHNQCGFGYRD